MFDKHSFFRGKRNYRELDVNNPLTSKLFNKKRSMKILIHGYTGEAMKGIIVYQRCESKNSENNIQ